MTPVSTSKLELTAVTAADDATVNWAGAYATYGGAGSELSSVVSFTIAPGGHLGWHIDSTEETQLILAGSGELRRADGAWPVSPDRHPALRQPDAATEQPCAGQPESNRLTAPNTTPGSPA